MKYKLLEKEDLELMKEIIEDDNIDDESIVVTNDGIQVEERDEEYNRIWQVSWDLKLLNRKEKLYLKIFNESKTETLFSNSYSAVYNQSGGISILSYGLIAEIDELTVSNNPPSLIAL